MPFENLFGHDKSYENVFLEEGKTVIFFLIKTVKIPSSIYSCCYVQNKVKKKKKNQGALEIQIGL